MKTEVTMIRKFLSGEVGQKSKSGFYNATELIRLGNKVRLNNDEKLFSYRSYINSQTTQDFIKELELEYGDVIETTKGRNGATWVHKYLFLDLALSISPKFKKLVYKMIDDGEFLIKHRNNSGTTYLQIKLALYKWHKNHQTFPEFMKRVAFKIREACLVGHGKDVWQKASMQQLEKRNLIHLNIVALSHSITHNEEIVELAIKGTDFYFRENGIGKVNGEKAAKIEKIKRDKSQERYNKRFKDS